MAYKTKYILCIILFSSFCSSQPLDQRYRLAYDYIVNSAESKTYVIPYFGMEDSSKITLPISIEVSPTLDQLYLSGFISIYNWLYPKISKDAASDSLIALSRLEDSLPTIIDSTYSELATLTNSSKAKYILFFSIIANNKMVANLYPKPPNDRMLTTNFTRACGYFFLFTADGKIEQVHYGTELLIKRSLDIPYVPAP